MNNHTVAPWHERSPLAKSDAAIAAVHMQAEINELRALLSAVQADQQPAVPAQPVAPEGYVLVPVELTEEMHVAAVRTIQRCTGNDDFPPRIWCAMLAAAPVKVDTAVPSQQVVSKETETRNDVLEQCIELVGKRLRQPPSEFREVDFIAALGWIRDQLKEVLKTTAQQAKETGN